MEDMLIFLFRFEFLSSSSSFNKIWFTYFVSILLYSRNNMQGYIKEHFGTSKKSKEKASTKVGSGVRHLNLC